jgi:hypothetical protein
MGPPARLPPLTPPPVVRRGLLTLQAWSTKPSCKSGDVGLSLVVAVIAEIRVFLPSENP